MCGIVGIFNLKNSEETTFSEKNKAFLIKYLLTELTIETESRGKDATGYCALFQDGETLGLKHGLKASEFCTKYWDEEKLNFKNHLKLIEAYHNEISPVASILSHCRAKTIGSETNNDNNHPLYVGNLVGIHNGCLSNHTKIFGNIKEDIIRVGDVDSEMIFQLMWLELKKGELGFCDNVIKGVTEKLDGTFAVISIDKKNPDSILFFRDTRPIEFIHIKEAGFIIALSEKRFFENTVKNYEWLRFYGANLHDFTYECFTLPDDNACILQLDTKVTKGDSIESILKPLTKIERTQKEWKTYTYGGVSQVKGHSRHNLYEDDDDYNFPGAIHSRDKVNYPPAVVNQEKKDEKKEDDKNKAGPTNVVKEVEPVVTDKEETVEIVSWNEKDKSFDFTTAPVGDIYVTSQKLWSDNYTIYKNCKILASKLDIPVETLTSYTLPQIANRVSKIVYDEYINSKAKELKEALEKIKKFEQKSEKARKHILTLRGILNTIVVILAQAKSVDYSKLTFNAIEKRILGQLWEFLYTGKKASIQDTALGKFIYKLGHKNDEQTTGKTD